ncbi:hypothetical protein J4N02_03310 [Propioniciclava sp. MC1595]|uniref:hypothetical protein n=1 Tax=Propioniciclava sp. MC1595 TaxID=2760308 RepID=UPI0016627296|nr:hypothetical protein [Propioniciclava sp. MC1595]MBB1496097.1 hypothetical protein [Propioniciclava sp. MC1595]QTE26658.1 hypothetical protein J4N02_03310 [Propioniciclava sp. MC1595]
MTTSTDYPFRSGQLRRAGVLMRLPRVVISAVVWLLVIEALPVPAAWGVLAVVVVGTVAGVVAEPVIVCLVWWARHPSTPLTVPGDPRVAVLVTGRRAAGIGQAGRRHLVVPAAWIGGTDLPALLTRARQRQLVSAGRFDVAYQWFTWPWEVLGSFVNGLAHGASGLPLIGFAWRLRIAVAGIAVWQTVVAGQHAATVGIVVVIGLTYLLPWTRARHQRLVSGALADLERSSATPAAPASRRPVVLPVRPTATHAGRRPCTSARRCGLEHCGQWRSHARLVTCTGEGIHGRAHDPRTTGRKGSRS